MITSAVLFKKNQKLKEQTRSVTSSRHHATIRTQRAISWISYAEREQSNDMAFVCYWIAFNAVYGEFGCPDRVGVKKFLKKIVSFDRTNRIYAEGIDRCSHIMNSFVRNQFVYDRFWECYHNNEKFRLKELEDDHNSFNQALLHKNASAILRIVFNRLYTLRNQVFHGSSTNSGSVNRGQVDDGATIMRHVVPIMVGVMMDNPDEEWNKPQYPGNRLETYDNGKWREIRVDGNPRRPAVSKRQ